MTRSSVEKRHLQRLQKRRLVITVRLLFSLVLMTCVRPWHPGFWHSTIEKRILQS